MSSPRHSRRGLSLLELIVASAIAVVLMAAVSAAIHMYSKSVDIGRSDVEEAQLGRAVMKLMEDDLRNCIWKNDIDFSSVEALAADQASSAASSLTDAASGAGLSGGADLASEADAASNTTDLAASTSPAMQIGLYGNATELQFDMSRLPRVDEYDPEYVGFRSLALADKPSDVKTVTYYLLVPGTAYQGVVGDPADRTAEQTGLVRRVLDRSVTQWALENGDTRQLDASGEIVAPEVCYLNFRYFDGYEWYEEWDSAAMDGLPLAVDIVLAIRSADDRSSANQSDEPFVVGVAEGDMVYRRLVRIPIAVPIDPLAEEEETTESGSSTESAL
ncbi:type II secretion system protein GspJ [Blastopirellula sp. JC732]|uniref:Type II secretion system protein GspJ n=1 Tax=Blastopirellula sediminis TaxID=2894196 RepID=A0A9X1MH39_9BACT|nr:prepilin-type N-terminal cleavage/methylation domain-containing protein [Blastopirellula sediminis]MCC9608219.1 type II secretion system protein GspJ [Blastopirellula sediminis]MCC9626988.1 type II secretion system protein GspJ [Blastopirellula sediminis]